jgi:hypothetical protein
MQLLPYSRTDCNPNFVYYVRQYASSILTLTWGKITPHKESVLWVCTHTVTYVTSCYLPRELAIVFATVMECPLLAIWILLHLWYDRHI